MRTPTTSAPPSVTTPRRRPAAAIASGLLALTTALGLSACSAEAKGPHLSLTAAVPDKVPDGTVLRVGDPGTQVALEHSDLGDRLEAEGVDVQWANISGGPQTLEAFRANALDLAAVADIPPLFAQWTGSPVKIVAARTTKDPLAHPTYELGVAPGQHISSLADLKGHKIAYSPGQAQGALVLRVLAKAGLTQRDVDLVEMTSVEDSYVTALGSKQVDVAPLGQMLAKTYLAQYQKDGASTVDTGIRDDAATLYAPTEVLEDADKAAAVQKYVAVWAQAEQWINAHPDDFAKYYYQDVEGLSAEDAAFVVKAQGTYEVATSWDDVIARHQQTADLLSKEQGRDHLDVADLYDRRFEKAIAAAVQGQPEATS